MEVESLSDVDLRKMLMEHGVAAGPVTDTTRNVLQNKLSKVISSESGVQGEQIMESYTVEEVVNTASCIVTEGDSERLEDYSQSYNTEIQTPSRYEHTQADLDQNEDLESYSSRSYEYTPTSQSLRYARDSYPCGDNLKRRPLSTHKVGTVEHTSTKIEKTTHLGTADCGKTCTKKRWVCSRMFIILLLLVIFFVLLVYYHMEHNDVQSLPADATPPAVKPSTVANESSS